MRKKIEAIELEVYSTKRNYIKIRINTHE